MTTSATRLRPSGPPPPPRSGPVLRRWANTVVSAARRIDAALVAPGSAHRLAAVRAGLAAVIALRVATGPYSQLAGQPAALFRPPPFLSWLPAMPPVEVLVALQVLGTAAALAAAAGWRPGRTFALAWLTLLVLAGLRGSLGKVLHNDLLLLLAAVPVLLAPADARLGDRRSSARWGWPVRGALAVVAVVYLACGVQKLRYSGLSWVTGDNVRWILRAGAATGRAPTDELAQLVADRAWLAHGVAAAVLGFELAAPLLLAWSRARPLFVAGAALLHTGTWLTLGLDYWGWALAVAVIALAGTLDLGGNRLATGGGWWGDSGGWGRWSSWSPARAPCRGRSSSAC